MQAEKDESFRSESKKKAIFNGFNFRYGEYRFIPLFKIPAKENEIRT